MLKDKQIQALYRQYTAGPLAKVYEGAGLCIKDGHLWRYEYSFEGRRATLSFGSYPETSLRVAREKHAAAQAQLAQGLNPDKEAAERKAKVKQEAQEKALTFEFVAREWFAKRTRNLTEKYRKEKLQRIEKHLLPYIGSIPMAELKVRYSRHSRELIL